MSGFSAILVFCFWSGLSKENTTKTHFLIGLKPLPHSGNAKPPPGGGISAGRGLPIQWTPLVGFEEEPSPEWCRTLKLCRLTRLLGRGSAFANRATLALKGRN